MSTSAQEGDLRTRRTKTHLRRALAELMSKRSLRDITVGEVCETAMVHRTTFYKHYADKHALFDDLLDDRIGQLFSAGGLPPERPATNPGEPIERLASFFGEMRADQTLVRLLADPDLSPFFTQRLTRELVQQLQDRAPRARSQQAALRADLLAKLNAAVLAAAMAWWAQGNGDVSAQQLARTVWTTLGPAELTEDTLAAPRRRGSLPEPHP